METIRSLLNKIKWAKPSTKDYIIEYHDRIENDLKQITFKDIKEINKFSIVLDGKEIPLHRIRRVFRNNMCIWRRDSKL